MATSMSQTQKDLELKASLLDEDFNTLETSLTKEPLDQMEVATNLSFAQRKLEEYKTLKQAYYKELLKKDQDADAAAVERKYDSFVRRMCNITIKVEAASVSPEASDSNVFSRDQYRMELPKRELPKFKGDVREWLSFWAIFSEIHKDPKIPTAQKHHYLIQSTVPESPARKLVMSYPVCDKNYKLAVDALTERFGRDSMLIKVYVRDLLKLIVENSHGKSNDFASLVTNVTSQIRNLDTLGVTQDKCALILYPVVESCLPDEVLIAWQRHGSYKEDLEALITFLNAEVNNQAERKLAQSSFQEKKDKSQQQSQRAPRFQQGNRRDVPTASSLLNTTKGQDKEFQKGKCAFCDGRHTTRDCRKAISMPLKQKEEMIAKRGHCFKCLDYGHSRNNCRTPIKCGACGDSHTVLMCHEAERIKANRSGSQGQRSDSPVPNMFALNSSFNAGPPLFNSTTYPTPPPSISSFSTASNSTPQAGTQTHGSLTNVVCCTEVPLMTLQALAVGPTGKSCKVRIMLDTGSHKSYIVRGTAKALGLFSVGTETIIHAGWGGKLTDPQQEEKVRMIITTLPQEEIPQQKRFYLHCVLSCTEKITGLISRTAKDSWVEDFHKAGIGFNDLGNNADYIDVLLGNDLIGTILTGERYQPGPGPTAFKTFLGWVLAGVIGQDQPLVTTEPRMDLFYRELVSNSPSRISPRKQRTSSMIVTSLIRVEGIEDMWSLDSIGITDSATKQSKAELQEQALVHFQQTVSLNQNGRYEVRLPWISGTQDSLKPTFNMALKRLEHTTNKLKKQQYLDKYDELFKQWEQDGMIEEVGDDNHDNSLYLPHRAVVKLNSSTTPIRPVFDASAKAKGCMSLNDCLEKGPNLLELIPAILTRFRLHNVATTSDIKKAFQQISVAPVDRNYLRFLWWKDLSCKEVKIYRHCRVVFGVSSSPFLLGATLQHHLTQGVRDDNRKTIELLLHTTYVDNCLASLPTTQDALQFKDKAQELLSSGKFDLRGWEFGPTSAFHETHMQVEKTVPVLGMVWNNKYDVLQIDVSSFANLKENEIFSKRVLLSYAHMIFDPLGFLAPFILQAKLLLRECHSRQLSWDTPLPEDLNDEFLKWKQQLPHIAEFRVSRNVFTDNALSLELHTFCDASQDAYAAAVYLRVQFADNIKVSLLQAKTRVTPPKKKITIPRLELLSCTIAARLAKTVQEYLVDPYFSGVSNIFFWTDSTTALQWIRGVEQWGIFVNNRVNEIRSLTNLEDWRHIPGKSNPADLPSRGSSLKTLLESRWWEGPSWLYNSIEHWPRSYETADETLVNQEKRKIVQTTIILDEEPSPIKAFLACGSYQKVIRSLSYWLLFIRAAKEKVGRKSYLKRRSSRLHGRKKGEIPNLKPQDLLVARNMLIKYIQEPLKANNLYSIRNLRPFLDNNGIIRTRTRLTHADTEAFKTPVILPDKDEFTSLIIRYYHEAYCHAGVQYLHAITREKFWIINGRRAIRTIVHSCAVCRRFLATRLQAPEAPLPAERTGMMTPFSVTGVDLAGPLILKNQKKAWIILFTCATYRAVHLEATDKLSTDAFLTSLRRFVSRRGRPDVMYSDNGLNFVGAARYSDLWTGTR